MTRYEKIKKSLQHAAKRGLFKTELTMFYSYIVRLRHEGFKVEILNRSPNDNNLVKVSISWEEAANNISASALDDYVYGYLTLMPNFAFELYITAYRVAAA